MNRVNAFVFRSRTTVIQANMDTEMIRLIPAAVSTYSHLEDKFSDPTKENTLLGPVYRFPIPALLCTTTLDLTLDLPPNYPHTAPDAAPSPLPLPTQLAWIQSNPPSSPPL